MNSVEEEDLLGLFGNIPRKASCAMQVQTERLGSLGGFAPVDLPWRIRQASTVPTARGLGAVVGGYN